MKSHRPPLFAPLTVTLSKLPPVINPECSLRYLSTSVLNWSSPPSPPAANHLFLSALYLEYLLSESRVPLSAFLNAGIPPLKLFNAFAPLATASLLFFDCPSFEFPVEFPEAYWVVGWALFHAASYSSYVSKPVA
jgi:hypothetical protein